MVKLEHVNLVVSDIDKTVDFIQTAFPDWVVRGRGESEWYGNKRNWVHVGNDDYYITLNDKAEGNNRNLKSQTAGLAHIGFAVDDVAAISARLQNKGYQIATIGADHPYRKTIYFIDPAGFEFEFIQYLSEIPEQKNMYGGETSAIQRLASA
ncbi:MAG: VOC family protein [Oceanospirillaceae bacterium]|nr:VOC family protein [Oceanospirillaceae bacterium]NRB42752.1 VOC family protein [Pseudomonadales bacterium]